MKGGKKKQGTLHRASNVSSIGTMNPSPKGEQKRVGTPAHNIENKDMFTMRGVSVASDNI
jgi:hypothetical protein